MVCDLFAEISMENWTELSWYNRAVEDFESCTHINVQTVQTVQSRKYSKIKEDNVENDTDLIISKKIIMV